ncbi:MAG: S9 family peptidase [Acidobacteriota bacterium]
MHMDGGEAWPVTHHEEGIQSFRISPDGTRIAFVTPDPLSEKEKEKKKKKDDAEIVDEKFKMQHLWLLDVKTGETSRLTQGKFTVSDPQWSPASDRIAYVTRPNPTVDESWNSDIWVVGLQDRSPRKLYENPGRDISPRWSPDGRTLAFASEPTPGTNTWHNKLYLVSAQGGQPRILLGDFDLNFQSPVWSSDGRRIFAATGERTSWNLMVVDVRHGEINIIHPPRGGNSQWELSRDGGRWVWVHTGPGWPAEVYTASSDLEQARRISQANLWLEEEGVERAQVEVVRWKNSEGEWIEGVLTRPVGYQPGQRYPLILNPHGGPSGAVTESFNTTNQFLAGNGFMILQPNFRGSANYGQAFLNANRGNWGIRDYDDCMTGVDYCIRQGWADPDRLLCYGWSYGGYMSFWISTQTDRFKGISPGAGLTNLYSMYSTTDIPHYLGWFFGNPLKREEFLGTPWDSEEAFVRQSPIRYVRRVSSPMLILHGGSDKRVPPTQAVEFYRALRDLGKDVTFVRYPREGHGLREPRHQLDRLRRYLSFFARHVGLTPVSEPEPQPEAEVSSGNP